VSKWLAVVGYYALLLVAWCAIFFIGACMATVALAILTPFACANGLIVGLALVAFIYAAVNIALYGTSMYRASGISSEVVYPENGWE
jgi:hypothetical protein